MENHPMGFSVFPKSFMWIFMVSFIIDIVDIFSVLFQKGEGTL